MLILKHTHPDRAEVYVYLAWLAGGNDRHAVDFPISTVPC
jgi:hypothetical protein